MFISNITCNREIGIHTISYHTTGLLASVPDWRIGEKVVFYLGVEEITFAEYVHTYQEKASRSHFRLCIPNSPAPHATLSLA